MPVVLPGSDVSSGVPVLFFSFSIDYDLQGWIVVVIILISTYIYIHVIW